MLHGWRITYYWMLGMIDLLANRNVTFHTYIVCRHCRRLGQQKTLSVPEMELEEVEPRYKQSWMPSGTCQNQSLVHAFHVGHSFPGKTQHICPIRIHTPNVDLCQSAIAEAERIEYSTSEKLDYNRQQQAHKLHGLQAVSNAAWIINGPTHAWNKMSHATSPWYPFLWHLQHGLLLLQSQ